MKKEKKYYLISDVAEKFGVHPQTLRLYEREGLLVPIRSEGNTRMYDEEALKKLKIILTLTRELGVNLAGVEVILNMREKIIKMQKDFSLILEKVREDILKKKVISEEKTIIPVPPSSIVKK